MIDETWLPVPMFANYEISDLGNVRRWWSNMGAYKPVKPCKDGRGYFNFSVRANGKPMVLLIHREVASLFKPNIENYKLVRHLNDIKTDNRAINLAWGTYAHNRKDAVDNGKMFHEPGKRPAQAKLTPIEVKAIFEDPENNCWLAELYGVTESTISKIKLGRGWNSVTGLPVRKHDYRPRKTVKINDPVIHPGADNA